MDILLILVIILGIAVAFAAFKLLGKVVNFISTVAFFILFLIAIFGIVVYVDYATLSKQADSAPVLFVFVRSGVITNAANAKGFSMINSTELTGTELRALQKKFDANDFKAMQNSSYKVVMISETGYNETYKTLAGRFRNDGMREINLGIRDGNVVVYPMSFSLEAIKRMPKILVDKNILLI